MGFGVGGSSTIDSVSGFCVGASVNDGVGTWADVGTAESLVTSTNVGSRVDGAEKGTTEGSVEGTILCVGEKEGSIDGTCKENSVGGGVVIAKHDSVLPLDPKPGGHVWQLDPL